MRRPSIFVSILGLALFALACGCAADAPETDHDEPADYEVEPDDGKGDGVSAVFDMHDVMTDALMTGSTAMEASDVQRFLETTPYGTRSWLASYSVGGKPVSQLVVDAARAHGIHPIVLLARMQTETSLVSKTVRPSQRLIDRALGCACPDGGTCSTSQAGLAAQLDCGARILRKWYDGSVDGTGLWRRGVSKRTLDPRTVTPRTHATASLYAYTPWVLVNTGGTWLVWNITRKYVRNAESRGLLRVSL